jgi:hypothetical protein
VSTGWRTPATGRSATLMNSSTDEAFVTRKPVDDHFAPHRNEHWLTCPCRKLKLGRTDAQSTWDWQAVHAACCLDVLWVLPCSSAASIRNILD